MVAVRIFLPTAFGRKNNGEETGVGGEDLGERGRESLWRRIEVAVKRSSVLVKGIDKGYGFVVR